MESSTLPNDEVIDATADIVAVASHLDKDHGTYEAVENGRKVSRCKIYPNLTCDDHERTARVGGLYIKGRFAAPVSIWCDSTGKETSRHFGFRQPEVFLKDLKAALEKVPGPRVSKADYDRQGPPLLEGERALAEGQYKSAIAGLTKAADGKMEAIRKAAEIHLAEVRKTGEDLLARARRHIDRGQTKSARSLLTYLAEEFGALECGRVSAELLNTAGVEPKDKEK
jgi:hypothetical protein